MAGYNQNFERTPLLSNENASYSDGPATTSKTPVSRQTAGNNGSASVTCIHCGEPIDTLNDGSLAICQHCRMKTPFGVLFRKKWLICLVLCLVSLVIGSLLAVVTKIQAVNNETYSSASGAAYFAALIFFVCALYDYRKKAINTAQGLSPESPETRNLAHPTSNLESNAESILQQGVDFDIARRYPDALMRYEQGIEILSTVLRENAKNSVKCRQIRKTMEDYEVKAEIIKINTVKVNEQLQTYRTIRIRDDDINYSYDVVFGPLITNMVSHIVVEDAYIRKSYQLSNFRRFNELAMKLSPNLRKIVLVTGEDNDPEVKKFQRDELEKIKKKLNAKGIRFVVHFSTTLHDREIRFNNGFVVKSGRGLDYFKPVPQLSAGYYNYAFRPCSETTIDIFSTDHNM